MDVKIDKQSSPALITSASIQADAEKSSGFAPNWLKNVFEWIGSYWQTWVVKPLSGRISSLYSSLPSWESVKNIFNRTKTESLVVEMEMIDLHHDQTIINTAHQKQTAEPQQTGSLDQQSDSADESKGEGESGGTYVWYNSSDTTTNSTAHNLSEESASLKTSTNDESTPASDQKQDESVPLTDSVQHIITHGFDESSSTADARVEVSGESLYPKLDSDAQPAETDTSATDAQNSDETPV